MNRRWMAVVVSGLILSSGVATLALKKANTKPKLLAMQVVEPSRDAEPSRPQASGKMEWRRAVPSEESPKEPPLPLPLPLPEHPRVEALSLPDPGPLPDPEPPSTQAADALAYGLPSIPADPSTMPAGAPLPVAEVTTNPASIPNPTPTPTPPPTVSSADPVQNVEAFLLRNRKEADDSIRTLSQEAETLRARLEKVEAALGRWQVVADALNQEPTKPTAIEPEARRSTTTRPQRPTTAPPEANEPEPSKLDPPTGPPRVIISQPDLGPPTTPRSSCPTRSAVAGPDFPSLRLLIGRSRRSRQSFPGCPVIRSYCLLRPTRGKSVFRPRLLDQPWSRHRRVDRSIGGRWLGICPTLASPQGI